MNDLTPRANIGFPPIGLLPRFLWIEYRLDEVNQAINRYVNAYTMPLQEWLDEKRDLEEWLNQRRAMQKLDEILNPGEKNVD